MAEQQAVVVTALAKALERLAHGDLTARVEAQVSPEYEALKHDFNVAMSQLQNTMGVVVDVPTALLLCVVSAVCACGASGVPGGSLLLIPLACSLFGISNDVAMQVVAVGFIIGVLQDSAETALNSSTDIIFTAAACMADQQRKA